MIQISLDKAVCERWEGEAVLGACFMQGLDVRQRSTDFEADLAATMADLKARGNSVLSEPRVELMRQTFKAMPDMDPARYRPASESLIRRYLDKGPFRINPLVDLNNLLSVRLRVPLGIYDLSSWPASAWVYRIGFVGEKYSTISNQMKSADGKLVLADEQGVIGSPVADSGRAPIKGQPNRIAIIAFLPFGTSRVAAGDLCSEIEAAFGRSFILAGVSRQVVTLAG